MVPTQQRTGEVAHGQHAAYFYRGGDEGCTAYAFQLVKAELQSQREQQEDNADFRPGVDVGLIGNRREEVEVRTGDEAGNNVTKHQRLINFLEKNSRDTGYKQNHC